MKARSPCSDDEVLMPGTSPSTVNLHVTVVEPTSASLGFDDVGHAEVERNFPWVSDQVSRKRAGESGRRRKVRNEGLRCRAGDLFHPVGIRLPWTRRSSTPPNAKIRSASAPAVLGVEGRCSLASRREQIPRPEVEREEL
jgi:hypothetical protein